MKYKYLVASGIAKLDEYSIVEIDLLKFSKYMSNKPDDRAAIGRFWCIASDDRIWGDFKEEKYLRNIEHIKNNEGIYIPELLCKENKHFSIGFEVNINDGRHRIYAFIDSGYTKLDVFCPVEDAEKIKSMF